MPANDLLARIAKALEDDKRCLRTQTLGSVDRGIAVAARILLPEAQAALKIAVEALEDIARPGGNAFATPIAREALSRLTSAEKS